MVLGKRLEFLSFSCLWVCLSFPAAQNNCSLLPIKVISSKIAPSTVLGLTYEGTWGDRKEGESLYLARVFPLRKSDSSRLWRFGYGLLRFCQTDVNCRPGWRQSTRKISLILHHVLAKMWQADAHRLGWRCLLWPRCCYFEEERTGKTSPNTTVPLHHKWFMQDALD